MKKQSSKEWLYESDEDGATVEMVVVFSFLIPIGAFILACIGTRTIEFCILPIAFVVQNKIDYSKQTEFLSAWSLHRLIEMLPDEIDDCYSLTFNKKYLQYEDYVIEIIKSFRNSSIYNNIIDCIEWLISEGYFNEEYLKQ